MANLYKDVATGITGPGRHIQAVTPNDSADLPNTSRSLLVCGAGDVVLVSEGGEEETVPFLAGQQLDLCVVRVKATGTTATSIFALW